jgi:hypothetical protein
MINPNYPSYSSEVAEEPIDLTPVTDALKDVEKAVLSKKAVDSVEVNNIDFVKKYLREELAAVVKAINAIDIPEAPKKLEVTNFPKAEKAPESIKVNNLSELSTLLDRLLTAVEGINVNPVVNLPAPIVNIPEQPSPVVNIPPQLSPIVDINIDQLLQALQPLRLLSRDPNKPITVRMSDGRHFIDALTATLKENGERLATVVSTSYGLTQSEYKAAQNELELPTARYSIADKDADASPNYYGFTDAFGNWYIMKETVSAGADTYRYCKGSSGYTTAWTNRAGQSYDYFYEVF